MLSDPLAAGLFEFTNVVEQLHVFLGLLWREQSQCWSRRCAGKVRVESMFIDVIEVGCQRVEVFLSDRIVFMVMASGAFKG